MDDEIEYPDSEGISDEKLRSWACIDPEYWEMVARALFNPAETIVAVRPDGSELRVRNGWTERGHRRVYQMPVECVEAFEALCRAAESAIEAGIDDIDEVVAWGLSVIARAKKSLM